MEVNKQWIRRGRCRKQWEKGIMKEASGANRKQWQNKRGMKDKLGNWTVQYVLHITDI